MFHILASRNAPVDEEPKEYSPASKRERVLRAQSALCHRCRGVVEKSKKQAVNFRFVLGRRRAQRKLGDRISGVDVSYAHLPHLLLEGRPKRGTINRQASGLEYSEEASVCSKREYTLKTRKLELVAVPHYEENRATLRFNDRIKPNLSWGCVANEIQVGDVLGLRRHVEGYDAPWWCAVRP